MLRKHLIYFTHSETLFLNCKFVSGQFPFVCFQLNIDVEIIVIDLAAEEAILPNKTEPSLLT